MILLVSLRAYHKTVLALWWPNTSYLCHVIYLCGIYRIFKIDSIREWVEVALVSGVEVSSVWIPSYPMLAQLPSTHGKQSPSRSFSYDSQANAGKLQPGSTESVKNLYAAETHQNAADWDKCTRYEMYRSMKCLPRRWLHKLRPFSSDVAVNNQLKQVIQFSIDESK